jgi:glycosyltransferase involved in cell wall biosynthesis
VISFIVPAHNEELLIGATLASIHAAAREAATAYELIVVDDASTDATAQVAAANAAQVIHVNNRQISATRNCGARAARGEILIFVDADTVATADAVRDIIAAIDGGAAGGGCLFRFDGRLPRWARLTFPPLIRLFRRFNFVGGCFLFCTRQTFDAIGGFSKDHFAAEELIFRNAVRRVGKFVIPPAMVVTSGRKLRAYSGFEILWTLVKITIGGTRSYRGRKGLEVWYGERRADPEVPTST